MFRAALSRSVTALRRSWDLVLSQSLAASVVTVLAILAILAILGDHQMSTVILNAPRDKFRPVAGDSSCIGIRAISGAIREAAGRDLGRKLDCGRNFNYVLSRESGYD
jgi:hypothetical protein